MRVRTSGKTLALFAMSLALLLSTGVVLATPTPPYVFVNDSTRQCAVAIHGDDCSWCEPPQGWQVLGELGAHQCPAGYTKIEKLNFDCKRYKNQFCCTGGSHHGDCEDMVVNESQKLCAFVASIAGCNLPAGWASRPSDVTEYAWICPFGYQWGSEVACLAETALPQPTVTEGLVAAPTRTSEPADAGATVQMNMLLYFALALIVAWLALIILFVARRSGRPGH